MYSRFFRKLQSKRGLTVVGSTTLSFYVSASFLKSRNVQKNSKTNEKNPDKIMLYGYWRSSCTWRVRNALNLKGIKYDTTVINLLKSQQLSNEYSKLNPIKQVPTLKINDKIVLTQSLAIISYIDSKYSNNNSINLIPKDTIKKSQVLKISEIINSGIQPLQNLSTQKKLVKYIKNICPELNENDLKKIRIEWSKEVISEGFDALEKELSKVSGKYCVGDELSMADCCLVPQVYNAIRYGIDMKKFPNILRINNNCMELEAFKNAHPNNQIDAVL